MSKAVYDELPPEAKEKLVEGHLLGLLDSMPKARCKKVMTAATRLQTKFQKAPVLDLRAKRKQIADLLDDLARDGKTAFVKERSNREEILTEVVHSLISWLNDIWSIVYEYNVRFHAAHTCLLFVADALAQLSESAGFGGCKCSVLNLPIDFDLKDKNGKILKRFSIVGPQNIDHILLWIWRDLFVSLYAKGSERDIRRVPEYLEDIQAVMNTVALERLLFGGRTSDDEEDDEDEVLEDDDDFDHLFNACDEDEDPSDDEVSEDGSEYESDDESILPCSCNLHAHYWSHDLNRQRIPLKDCVEKRLFTIFRETPSLHVYNFLRVITSPSERETERRAFKILDEIAGNSAENLVAALDIFVSANETKRLVSMLDQHKYLIRPRDMQTLQIAVGTMICSPTYHLRGIHMLETEMEAALKAIYSNVRTAFAHLENEENKKELQEIYKLKAGTQARKDRIENWGESIMSSPGNHLHPAAFAAMIMGLPMLPGAEEGDDADLMSFVDFDSNDPDLDDLRDEFRPNLKAILDGWVHLAETFGGGHNSLHKIYTKAIELMPYVRGSDVANEMVTRLRERPSKLHVLEALSYVATFAKTQRKAINAKKKRNVAKQASSSKVMVDILNPGSMMMRAGPSTVSSPSPFPSSSSMAGPTTSATATTSPTPSPSATPVTTPSFTLAPFAFTFGGAPPPPSSSSSTQPPPLPYPFQGYPPLPDGMEDVD